MNLPEITPLDSELRAKLQERVDSLAKPPGALGRMEELAVRIGLIQGRLHPEAQRAILMVFAGDHGLTEEGVSRYPATVTLSMVQTFLSARASANAFAKATDVEMRVIDAGIAADFPHHPALFKLSVRRGTRNAAKEPALTKDEVDTALSRGVELGKQIAAQGFDILACGEMGIGNTASAALIMHRLLPLPLELCVGRGAGHDDAGLAHKLEVLQRAARRSRASAPRDVLAEFGGCEIAMMAGAILGAAAARRIIVVDGFISTAAALAAIRLNPLAQDYCIFSHCSAETGHTRMLQALGVEPLLNLEMRLGEGTGALLTVPLIRAAARLLSDVATLEEVLKGAQ